MKHSQDSYHNNQAGFAAILVTLIIVGIMTLITIGFVQVVSREGRDSLDRQLSTQAFYAAETGVNDAQKLINDGDLISAKTDCEVALPTWDPVLSDDGSIAYTCVLADFDLEELFYQNIATNHARSIILNAVDASGGSLDIDTITLRWRSSPYSGITAVGDSGFDFPVDGDFGPTGVAPVLRVSITPLNDLSRQALVQNTFTTFLRPTESGVNSVNYAAGLVDVDQQGTIQQVRCEGSDGYCEMTIDSLGFSEALLTVRAIYGEAELTIGSNADILFRDEQVLIDATGRASDVLRRIQVRLPAEDRATVPSFAIEAASGICKEYLVGGGPPTSDCLLD